MSTLLGDWIDVLDRLAIPLGVLLGIVLVAVFCRKAMRQSYESGKRFREKHFGTPPENKDPRQWGD